MAAESRSDLLAILTRYTSRPGLEIRRVERWRSRGWSFGRIACEAERVAAALHALEVRPGDRIALHLADGPLWHAAFFGALRAGAVAVPLDLSYEPHFLREIARDLGVAAWCLEREPAALPVDGPRVELGWAGSPRVGGAGRPAAAISNLAPLPWPADDPDRTAEIVLTSGTSGVPQAVTIHHRNLRAVLDGLEAGIERYRWALRIAPPISLAVALPLSHLYGQVMGAFVPALLGARAGLFPAMPAADLARALRAEGAWVLATVPRTLTLLGRYLRARGEARWGVAGMAARLARAEERPWPRRWAEFDPLRRLLGRRLFAVVSGGAALDPETEALWRALGYLVIQGYGLTETAPLVTLTHPFRTAPGSLGRPLPGVDIRIAGDGEILVRGPNVVAGSRGGPAVDAGGWLHTGDLGRIDASGRLAYLGRKGERIVTPAGVNVDPGPVVERLLREDGIQDAVVLERPWGERGIVCGVLLARPGADVRAAVRSANEDLPDSARVRSWHVWPEPDFPRTPTGKPQRAPIRAWLDRQAPADERRAAKGPVVPQLPAVPPPGDAGPQAGIARLVAEIAGVPPSELTPETRLGDLLTSLDRVELVTRLESTYGVTMGPEAFDGEWTLADAAASVSGAGAVSGAAPARIATRGTAEPAPAAPAVRTEIPPARWRFWPAVRATRFAFREACLRPFWGTFFAMDVGGLEFLDGMAPPYILAANHLSELDPGAVLFGLPRARSSPVATTAMWEYFPRARTGPALYALAVWGLNLIPLAQAGDWRPTLRIAGAVADAGGCPLVYPEGERSLDGALLPFHPGVSVMAQELHLPIVPCGTAGLLSVLPKGSHWARNCWRGRAPVAVRFGAPLPPPSPGADLGGVVAELKARIRELTEEAFRANRRW
ncbi:MAG TPA: AMP-binding protein [Gemmatimonadota bacterium]|nr:AMP-binding protein [Gemmatimonadota bacterium]